MSESISPSFISSNTVLSQANGDNSQHAKQFISWYKHMIDHERQNFCLYLSDDALLEWFGRTIKTRKKVSAFLKYDMQCSKHDFVSVLSVDQIQNRHHKSPRKEEQSDSPSKRYNSKPDRILRKRLLRSNCGSPEWAVDCKPEDKIRETQKELNENDIETSDLVTSFNKASRKQSLKRSFSNIEEDCNGKGDGIIERRVKCKVLPVTPPNQELGQGDCKPSTSGTDSDRSHETLNAQLPKLYVECNGYIQFTRSKHSHNRDSMKWERKCKIQISYSEDPLNIGEYIIWSIYYTDESRCRRNLLPDFEKIAMEDTK